MTTLEEAQSWVDNGGDRIFEAEVYRLKGEFLLSSISDNQHEAESCFQEALNVSRRQQAKLHELRAAMSMSRLWQSQGKRKEARDFLSDIYGWFTEGFDSLHLKDAKALLDEAAGLERAGKGDVGVGV